MKQAIIKLNGNQYQVSEGEEFLADKLDGQELKAQVLFVSDGTKAQVGTPELSKVKVELEVVEPETKGKKLYINKFRAKSRYRRKMGFRPVYTKLKVKSIK